MEDSEGLSFLDVLAYRKVGGWATLGHGYTANPLTQIYIYMHPITITQPKQEQFLLLQFIGQP